MAKDKVKVEFKVLKQSAEVGGKYYGIIDNSNPVNPTLTMQQIIDYKKLHNWSASQLGALVEDVLQGAAELVARDGQPRNLSSLLKFEARIKGTFANPEAAVTSQNVYVSPRMLKDIKASLDKGDFEFSNTNDSTDPRISSAALESDDFETWSVGAFPVNSSYADAHMALGSLTLSGLRLAPNGWTADCALAVEVWRNGALACNLTKVTEAQSGTAGTGGIFNDTNPTVASLNSLTFPLLSTDGYNGFNAWTLDADGEHRNPTTWTPTAGDELRFIFSRNLGTGESVETVKKVVLEA